jgi:HlyD family secretion protein
MNDRLLIDIKDAYHREKVIMKKRKYLLLMVGLMLVLTACSTADAATPEDNAVPAVVDTYDVLVDGRLVPSRHVELAFILSGQVADVFVSEGEVVAEGQPIAALEGRERYEAEVAAAKLELSNAEIALTDLLEGADLASAQAQMDLARARDEYRSMDYRWNVQQEGQRASEATLDAAEAELKLAKESLHLAKHRYDKDSDDPTLQLYYANAQKRYDSALRNWNWYNGKPTEIQQGLLDAELAFAQANVQESERSWNRVKDGPDPDLLRVAEERLELAQANLAAAEAALAETELRAPFTGALAMLSLTPGQRVSPNQTVAILADFGEWIVETENLTEIELPLIKAGQEASISFDSIADLTIPGKVSRISPYYEIVRGDVTYDVEITLQEIDPRLKWGMTAVVTFNRPSQ